MGFTQKKPLIKLKKPPHNLCGGFNLMAGEEGFEPSHAGIKIRCLNQLGDSPTQPFCLFPSSPLF
jgi:hypothetical protein